MWSVNRRYISPISRRPKHSLKFFFYLCVVSFGLCKSTRGISYNSQCLIFSLKNSTPKSIAVRIRANYKDHSKLIWVSVSTILWLSGMPFLVVHSRPKLNPFSKVLTLTVVLLLNSAHICLNIVSFREIFSIPRLQKAGVTLAFLSLLSCIPLSDIMCQRYRMVLVILSMCWVERGRHEIGSNLNLY